MGLQFDQVNGIPGIDSAMENVEKQVTWGKEQLQIRSALSPIDGAARDAGNSADTTILRPGLLMARVTSTGKLVQWAPTATDGSEKLLGPLLMEQKMTANGSNKDRWFGYILVGGLLKAKSLLIPGNASYGINGDNLELVVRQQLTEQGRFILDDEVYGASLGGWSRIVTVTQAASPYTVTEADNGTLFNTIGATGAVEFILPSPRKGVRVGFHQSTDYDMTLTAAAAGQLIKSNNAAADNLVLSSTNEKIGNFVEIVGISTSKLLAIPHAWGGVPSSQSLDGTDVSNVADANVIGGVPVIFRINITAGALGNTDVVMTHKVRVIDAWLVLRGAGVATTTLQVKNGANAITDAMDASGSDQDLVRAASIDDAYHEIAAAGTLRVTSAVGATQPNAVVYVSAIRVA